MARQRMRRGAILLGTALALAVGVASASADALSASASRTLDDVRLELPATLPARSLDVPILMYHRIDVVDPALPAITRHLTVDPRVFEAQMKWLVAHDYRAITQRQLFDALLGRGRLPTRPVLITFDDGYRNVFGKASPILQRLGLRATAYVIVERISKRDPSFLTWTQLRALERRGVEIGSHTLTHRDLTSLSRSELRRELRGSRILLERKLGHPVQALADPYGAHDARVVRMARASGYVLAVTTLPGSRQRARAPLELRRIQVLDSTGVRGLVALLGPR